MNCEVVPCGPLNEFTQDGCLRTHCTKDSDCDANEGCVLDFDTLFDCQDFGNGNCECESADSYDAGYCIPK